MGWRVRLLYFWKGGGVEVHRGEFQVKWTILSFGCNLGFWVGDGWETVTETG